MRPATSKRTASFTESVLRGMTRISSLEGGINLAQGFPDFPAPPAMKEAAKREIDADITVFGRGSAARETRMMGIGLLLIAALPALQATTAEVADHVPGRLRGIGGRSGFQSDSIVVFSVAPGAPHRLEAVYLYPDRARWLLRLAVDPPQPPTRYYRFGAKSWIMEPGAATSSEYVGRRNTTTLLQMELRRAIMLWPLGFDWHAEEDGTRSADVSLLQRLKKDAPIGSLEARFAPVDSGKRSKRPIAVRALRSDGSEIEELRVSEWHEFDGRAWPLRLTLFKDGGEVWRETVESIRTRRVPVDLFFQPPDHRPETPSVVLGRPAVRHIDFSPLTLREYELKRGLDWKDALARAHDCIEEAREEWGAAGPALDPVPSFKLDRRGRPTHCLVRLAKTQIPAPPGWKTLGDRPGMALVLEDLGQLKPEQLELLLRRAPKDAPLGSPYCRILRVDGPRGVQLYLPLAPAPQGE